MTWARAQVDMVCAMTMTSSSEAVGIALAARSYKLPVAISFTVETDGILPNGEKLKVVSSNGHGHYNQFMGNNKGLEKKVFFDHFALSLRQCRPYPYY